MEIAESLILSLDEKRASEIESAWAEEIKRRLESIDKGEVQLVPWDDMHSLDAGTTEWLSFRLKFIRKLVQEAYRSVRVLSSAQYRGGR